MYIDHIWPFTTFISRKKHNKNIRLRLYWLRLRVAEAEVQTSHKFFHNHAVLGKIMQNSRFLPQSQGLCPHLENSGVDQHYRPLQWLPGGGGLYPKMHWVEGVWGGCLPGVSAPVHARIHPPILWTEFLTHPCANITFPQQ